MTHFNHSCRFRIGASLGAMMIACLAGQAMAQTTPADGSAAAAQDQGGGQSGDLPSQPPISVLRHQPPAAGAHRSDPRCRGRPDV